MCLTLRANTASLIFRANSGFPARALADASLPCPTSSLSDLVPRSLLADYARLGGGVEKVGVSVDSSPEGDVELCLGEGGRDLVLDHFDFDMAADGASGGILEGLLAPDVEAHAGVKLQRLAAWRGFRVAEHDPYLLTQLVRKDAEGVALVEDGRELAEGLAHQPGLHAHRGHAHLPVELRLGGSELRPS